MHFKEFVMAQKDFSSRTFGPGQRLIGNLEHAKKEIEEIRESSGSLDEWIDLILIGIDGAWRTGATPDGIEDALIDKMILNRERQWPDWAGYSQDEAIEHIR